jgi:hypothetical protein
MLLHFEFESINIILIGDVMNYTKEEAAERNFKALAYLQGILQLLNERGALVGRDNVRIVVDLNHTPAIMLDEFGKILRDLSLVAPNGRMAIFSNSASDDEIMLLDINQILYGDDDIFSKFPAFQEVRELLESVHVMPKKKSEVFEAMNNEVRANLTAMILENPEGFLKARFSGKNTESDDWIH